MEPTPEEDFDMLMAIAPSPVADLPAPRGQVRRRLAITVPKAFALDLDVLGGRTHDLERVIALCLALHQGEGSPVFLARLRRIAALRGPQEQIVLWLTPEQAEAIVAGAARHRVTPGQFVAGVVSAAAQQLASRAR